mgnify:CR=1 FL=1
MIEEKDLPKILYIAGYGRCGSTLLSILLGNHEEIVSVGEVSLLLDEWENPNRICSCGEMYSNCKFWGGFLKNEIPHDINKTVRKIENINHLPLLLTNCIPKQEVETYTSFQNELFKYIWLNSQSSIIVDSSKSARFLTGRFLALHKLARQNIYVLHLVRDGIDTLASLLLKGRNWNLEGHNILPPPTALGCSIGWINANVWSYILGSSLEVKHYMCLKYEYLLTEPEKALTKIGRFIGFDPKNLIKSIKDNEGFSIDHHVGGNRIRLKKEIKLKKQRLWEKHNELNLAQKLTFRLVAGWLQRAYGYPIRHP